MNRMRLLLGIAVFLWAIIIGTGTVVLIRRANAAQVQGSSSDRVATTRRPIYSSFQMEVLVNGRPVTEYHARGRTYVEALHGAEYELRLRNSSPDRVAVVTATWESACTTV